MFPKIIMIAALIAIAAAVKTEKGAQKILSSYYKLPAKEQKKWDLLKIQSFIFYVCLAAALCTGLALIGEGLDLYPLRLLGNGAMILLGLFAIIWAYTGNRFKK